MLNIRPAGIVWTLLKSAAHSSGDSEVLCAKDDSDVAVFLSQRAKRRGLGVIFWCIVVQQVPAQAPCWEDAGTHTGNDGGGGGCEVGRLGRADGQQERFSCC